MLRVDISKPLVLGCTQVKRVIAVPKGTVMIKRSLIGAAVAVAAGLALTVPAHASVPVPQHKATAALAASGWELVYLHANSGNGCASNNRTHGSAVFSEPCSSSQEWEARDMTRSGGVQVGDKLEFITTAPTDQQALTWNPVQGWILGTPNDASTYVIVELIGNGSLWQSYMDATVSAGMYPKAAGVQLGSPAADITTAPPDEWLPCYPSNPTCGTGIVWQ